MPPPTNGLNDFSTEPLGDREVQKLRKLLQDHERNLWFWSTVRIWAYWIGGGIGALFAGREYIIKVIQALVL